MRQWGGWAGGWVPAQHLRHLYALNMVCSALYCCSLPVLTLHAAHPPIPPRGYTLAASPRSISAGPGLDARMTLLLDNLAVTPSWGVNTARERAGRVRYRCA